MICYGRFGKNRIDDAIQGSDSKDMAPVKQIRKRKLFPWQLAKGTNISWQSKERQMNGV